MQTCDDCGGYLDNGKNDKAMGCRCDNEPESPFGEVISYYTSEQAIEDGVLVHPYPVKFPWLLLTRSIHCAIEDAIRGSDRTYDQATIPLMQDAVMLARANPPLTAGHVWTDGLLGNVTGGPVWVGLNEKGGLTLMRPEDN